MTESEEIFQFPSRETLETAEVIQHCRSNFSQEFLEYAENCWGDPNIAPSASYSRKTVPGGSARA
jgi:hypothetical protein